MNETPLSPHTHKNSSSKSKEKTIKKILRKENWYAVQPHINRMFVWGFRGKTFFRKSDFPKFLCLVYRGYIIFSQRAENGSHKGGKHFPFVNKRTHIFFPPYSMPSSFSPSIHLLPSNQTETRLAHFHQVESTNVT